MRISDWSSDVCSSDLQKNIQNPEKILPFMRHKVSYLGGVRIPSFQKRLDELNALQGAQQKTTDIWNEVVGFLYSGQKQPDTVTIAKVNDIADTELRFP